MADIEMAFRHNNTVDENEPSWGDVDKTALPRQAFADMGEPDKKSTWKYPHHWVKGGTKKDDNGIWEDGELLLHRGGLNAAWAAANGARSGQKASPEVIAHLRAHRKALGLEDDSQSKSESSVVGNPRFVALVSRGEWAIEPSYVTHAFFAPDLPVYSGDILQLSGDRAVIKIRGALANDDVLFGTSYQAIRSALDRAVDVGVKHIVFDIDSPGGEVKGLFPLVSRINALKQQGIQITALVNDEAYSAAYLIASTADRIIMSPTGGVGSIGVISAHVDVSVADTLMGLRWTIVTAGEQKDLLNPHRPVTDEDIAYLKARVSGIYDMLVDAIAQNRGISPERIREYGARLYHGEQAVELGLVSEIVADPVQLLNEEVSEMNTEQTLDLAAERERSAAILAMWKKLKESIPFEIAERLITDGASIEEANKVFLECLTERTSQRVDATMSAQAEENILRKIIERKYMKSGGK